MIFAHADKPDGTRILMLGLSRGNIGRLLDGKPMLLKRETHGDGVPEGWEICVVFGETEQAIVDLLSKADLIAPTTRVIKEPKLEKE